MKKIVLSIILIMILILCSIWIYIDTEKEEKNELTSITLAEVTHSVFYAPLYAAIENGYFEDEGIDLEVILTPGADAVSAAVISGDAQIGFAGAESAVYIYEGGQKDYLQIFAGLTTRDGQFIVSREKMEDFSLEYLKGKEILTGRLSGMPALSFLNSLDNNGISQNELKINSSVEFAALTGSFIAGEGDFVNLFEPNATLLQNEGYGYIVASVGELSGEVPYTTFYSKKSYLKDNKEILEKFTNAINKGLNYVSNTDSKDIANLIISQFPDEDINNLIDMIENYKLTNSWLESPFISEKLFNNLEDFLIKFDLLENNTSYKNIVNNLYK